MKRKRWKVSTHACTRFKDTPGPYGLTTLTSCVQCGRIQNWRDVYPVGRESAQGRKDVK